MRLIDVDALMERLFDDTVHTPFFAPFKICTADRTDVRFLLNGEPTIDAVPVVRCTECKHRDPENHHCDHPAGTTIYFPRKDDDFCSYGERKDGDG